MVYGTVLVLALFYTYALSKFPFSVSFSPNLLCREGFHVDNKRTVFALTTFTLLLMIYLTEEVMIHFMGLASVSVSCHALFRNDKSYSRQAVIPKPREQLNPEVDSTAPEIVHNV